jgi:Peptidase A4 family
MQLTMWFAAVGTISKNHIRENHAMPEQPQRFTVPVGVSSPIDIKVLPDSICSVHPEGTTDPENCLKMYADDEGILRLHACPSVESTTGSKFVIYCTLDGTVTEFPLEIRGGAKPTPEMPAPLLVSRKLPKGAVTLPPLSEEDQLSLSDKELRTRGYPFRPDSAKMPTAFADWKARVSKPVITVVLPQSALRPALRRRRHPIEIPPTTRTVHPALAPIPTGLNVSPYYSYTKNWCGTMLYPSYFVATSPDRFFLVTGSWTVPTFTVPHFSDGPGDPPSPQHTAVWIGLDGYGTTGTDRLVQAGFVFAVVRDPGAVTLAGFEIVTEVYPKQGVEQTLPQNNVASGEYMTVIVQVGTGTDASSFQSGLPATAALFEITVASVTYTRFTVLTGCDPDVHGQPVVGCLPAANFLGTNAEWIVERPTHVDANGNQSHYPLAQFADFEMSYCYAYSNRSGAVPPFNNEDDLGQEISTQLLIITSDGQPSSTADPPLAGVTPRGGGADDRRSMTFQWHPAP